MGNWKYYQIIATFYRAFFNLVGQGVAYDEAANRVFNDFWFYPEEKNILINLIILTEYINVRFSIEREINIELVALFNSQIEKIDFFNLNKELNEEEIEHLIEKINEIKYKINGY